MSPDPALLRIEFLGLTVRHDDVEMPREDLASFFADVSDRYGLNRFEYHSDAGATLSHHHAVGTEHARWLEQDISAPGVTMLRALFDGVDPGANLDPGKITGVAETAAERNHGDVHLEQPSRRVVAEPVARPQKPEPAPATAAPPEPQATPRS